MAEAIVNAIFSALQSFVIWLGDAIKTALRYIYNFFADIFEMALNWLRAYVRWIIMGLITWYMIWYSVKSEKINILRKILTVLSAPLVGYVAGTVLDILLPATVTIPRWT